MVQLVREPTPSLHLTLGAAFGNIATKCWERPTAIRSQTVTTAHAA